MCSGGVRSGALRTKVARCHSAVNDLAQVDICLALMAMIAEHDADSEKTTGSYHRRVTVRQRKGHGQFWMVPV
jgi:hypothetical protein